MYTFIEGVKHHFKHAGLLVKNWKISPRVVSGYYKTLILKQNVLRTLEVAIESNCNSLCEMCYATKIVKPGEKMLTPSEYRDLWHQAKKLGAFSVIISGGEPTIRKDFFDVIKVFEPRETLICLVSNATKVSKEDFIRELYHVGLRTLHLSLDSTDPVMNDKIRGMRGHFDKVMNSIANAKRLGMNVYLSTVVAHNGLNKMREMVWFAKKEKIGIVFSLACPTGEWGGNKEAVLTPQEWKEVQDYMAANRHVRSDWTINFSLKTECPAGREKIAVSPHGEITGCGMNYVSFGSVREEPLAKIYKRIGNFSEFKRRPTSCLIGADHEYIDDYLMPLANEPILPVRIYNHPKKPMTFEELDAIN